MHWYFIDKHLKVILNFFLSFNFPNILVFWGGYNSPDLIPGSIAITLHAGNDNYPFGAL